MTTIRCSCGCEVEVENMKSFELDKLRRRPCLACRQAVRREYGDEARAEKIAEYRAAGADATRAAYDADAWIQAQRAMRGAS